MNAMIFAAGLGTRLAPITNNIPKALVEVHGKPLIWYAVKNVVSSGAVRIVINVYHFASQVKKYVQQLREEFSEVEFLISDESNQLMDTGGGLLYAKNLFLPDQPILIHNADVLTNVDLLKMLNFHNSNNALATLMVQDRTTNRFLLFNAKNHLCGWENTKTNEKIISRELDKIWRFAFDGVQIVNYNILSLLGDIRPFSITKAYLDLAVNNHILGWSEWEGQWFDVGTPQKYSVASENFMHN